MKEKLIKIWKHKMIKLTDWLNNEELKEYKSWDYNLDYEKTYRRLVAEISTSRRDMENGNITINRLKRFCYLLIGLTQLRNGARVGEIIEAFREYCEIGNKRIVQVRVQKRKDIYYRKIVLPDEIQKPDIELISSLVINKLNKWPPGELGTRDKSKRVFVQCLSTFFQENFNFSTHALRYSFISFMTIVKKIQVNVLAKITGHKTLDMILNYTNKKLADFELINLSGFGFT